MSKLRPLHIAGFIHGARARAWLCSLALAFAGTALADNLAEDLSKIEEVVDDLDLRSRVLEQQVAPGRSLRSGQAMARYQDAVYHHLIGEYEVAAEEFFALVTTGAMAPTGLEWDAQWYLAESLFLMNASEIAEGSYLTISADQSHPFREDAVRRLLEIYSRSDDPTRFDRLYEREVLRGEVEPSDVILYAVARAFVTKGDAEKAKSYFISIQPESAWYARARYFLGALLVQRGDETSLREAQTYFREIIGLAVVTDAGRQVYDLSLLALARIHYEFEEYGKAVESYDRIAGDSQFLDDKLHELGWTFIKQGDNGKAIQAIDIFLLGFPEHAMAAELQLVRGHLHYAESQFPEALESYQQVVDEYTPVQRRFGQLARSTDDTATWFEQVLELDRADIQGPKGDGELPAYAVSLMLADPGFTRALDLYREIGRQEAALDEARGIIDELEAALGGPVTKDAMARMRFDALEALAQGLQQRVAVLVVEEGWLRERGGSDVSGRLDDLARRRGGLLSRIEKVERQVERTGTELQDLQGAADRVEVQRARLREELEAAQVRLDDAATTGDAGELVQLATEVARLERETAELDAGVRTADSAADALDRAVGTELGSIELDLSRLWQDYQRLREPAGIDADMDPRGARLDSVHIAVDQLSTRLRSVTAQLSGVEDMELYKIRETFKTEVSNVGAEGSDLAMIESDASDLAETLVRANFLHLEELFKESVLGADIGMVNVYWSQWETTGSEKTRLTDERSLLISELEQRFGYLRQKLSQ